MTETPAANTQPTETREQHLADMVAMLRRKHPMLSDYHWKQLWERERLQWQIDDLREGIAVLVGKYGYHAEQNPRNTRLAALVAELDELLDSTVGSHYQAEPKPAEPEQV